MGNVLDGQCRRGSNESRDKDSPSTKSQRPSRRADERVEARITSCPWDEKLSLKADESLLANGTKMLKGNGNTTTLLFSLKRFEIVHQERRGQVKSIVMERHPLPQVRSC